MTRIVLDDVHLAFPRGIRGLFSRSSNARVPVLKGVSLDIPDGSTIGIVGRNGAGKTTLLRVIAGILKPEQGTVSVTGKAVAMFNLGVGAQPEASGLRNIELRCMVHGLSLKEARAKIPEIAAFSELGEALERPINTYSAGMALRLAFATLTALEPEILILDEWMGAGDASFRARAEKRMKEFAARARIMVLASHSVAIIRAICENCLWLDEGVVRRFGPTSEILSAYAEDVQKRNADDPEQGHDDEMG